jgi:hypothetical protein
MKHTVHLVMAVLFSCCGVFSFAQYALFAQAMNADYSKEAIIVERFATRVVYQPDGSGTRENIAVARIQSEAGVQSLAVLVFPYNSANERVEVGYIRVRKPDGSLVVTPAHNVQDMPATATHEAPMYSDLHEKQVPVKALSVGDVLEYLVRYRTVKPQVPGQFWFEYSFMKNTIAEEDELEISVPVDKYVKVSSPELRPLVKDVGSRRTYIWKTSNLRREETDGQPSKGEQPHPSVQITTFTNWGEVARWYGALQDRQVAITPEIRAKAAELTKGLVNSDDKIRMLYNFVSTHVHYISLSFGIGRYQPHMASEVLQNAYGDCKDKHTLLAALLRSAGYDAWPALINSSGKIDPDVPSPGQFDHVITVMPRGTNVVWLDTTPEVAPFALLLPNLLDKQALVIPTDSFAPGSLMKTPLKSPLPSWDIVTIRGKLNTNGSFAAHIQHSASGDMELAYRFAFRQYPQAQWDDLVQQHSWLKGSVHTVTASAPDDLDTPFEFAYDYSKNDYASGKGSVPLPIPPFPIETATNDEKKPTTPTYIGALGRTVYKVNIDLPTGYQRVPPKGVDLVDDFAEYHSRYTLTGGVLGAERQLIIKKTELPVNEWEQYLKFCKALRDDESGIENRGRPKPILFVPVVVLFVAGLITVVMLWNKSLPALPGNVFRDVYLTGIGGWLAFFIIRLWWIVVLDINGLARQLSPLGTALKVTYAVFAAIVAVLMMVKNPYGVKIAKPYLLLEASDHLFFAWVAAVEINSSSVIKLCWAFVGSILWWVYLTRSKRVRNTYFAKEWTEAEMPCPSNYPPANPA